MYRLPRLPLLLLVVLLALSALACSISGGSPEEQDAAAATPDQAALVAQAVATITAQLPAATAPAIVSQGAPITTDLEADLIALYERVNPSVVHIFIYDEADNPVGTGTGFIYDSEGHIVTNNHVVSGASRLEVAFPNGERRAAQTIGTDVDSDLGVIRVEELPAGAQPLVLGDSDNVRVGQFVVAIGNPFGEAGSLSLGIVSGLGRSLTSDRIAEGGGRYSLPQVIQTDAAINPGNSGGPLLNLAGEIVGVNSAIRTSTGTNSGVGFSIPVNAVRRIIPALIADGVYQYTYLGVRMSALDLATQTALGLPQVLGAYVTDVTAGSPAAAAGLRASGVSNLGELLPGGDLIIAADGRPINNPDDLISFLVFNTEVGQTVSLTLVRDGQQLDVPLTLGQRP
ncbi:MAG: trypsin-like peptidase domain-containing protein [Candidatus Promineofilum sp.]|nr:trypsin-like peptidase domain-containing protein [Promineifilum sp.]